MKLALRFLLAIVILVRLHAAPEPARYSGKTAIAGLGTISFPGGEWVLEFRNAQRAAENFNHRDYFVFKRVGNELARLTFIRYSSQHSPPLYHMLDGTREEFRIGIPSEEMPVGSTGWAPFVMRLVPPNPKSTEDRIEYSFIHTPTAPTPPGQTWLCNTLLFKSKGSAFVIVYAAPTVSSPELVQDVFSDSVFMTDNPAK
jgi:hypothetical protein